MPGTRESSLIAAVASALLQGAALIVFAVLSHLLPPAELGAYRQVLVIQSIVTIVAAMGIPTAMLYLVGRTSSREEGASAYGASLLWLFVSTLLCGALAGVSILAAAAYFQHDILVRDRKSTRLNSSHV